MIREQTQTGGVIKLSVKWEKPEPKHLVPTKWGWMVSYPESFFLGNNVDIGAFTYINALCGVVIYDNVQIGSHCSIYSNDTENLISDQVSIGENSKIGSHCLILPGAKIPANSKIKAYSIIRGEKYGKKTSR